MQTEGYNSNPPKGIFRWQHTLDELTINIGRDGQLIRNSGGRHRVSMARILGIEEIPARVLVRHPQAEEDVQTDPWQ